MICHKKLAKATIFFIFIALFIASCSSKESPTEGKWRVLDEQEYAPDINKDKVLSNLDELEKLIFAPTSFFKEKNSVHSFNQQMIYTTESVVNDDERELSLEETTSFLSDKKGNFEMEHSNSNDEGWSMVWKENFLYRKQLGGDYTKTISMGEHNYLKESLFNSIPSIYAVLRNNADIKSYDKKKIKGKTVDVVEISFSDKKVKRNPLPDKRYLQNLQGVEEIKNDQLIDDFSKKEKKNIKGSMTLFIDEELSVLKMAINSSFELKNEEIAFKIEGERTLSTKVAEQIKIPEYNEEYHRRTLDATVNIMKDKENKKEQDEQATESR
ncbi:MAG: hypothetical protein ACOX2F_02185 [bacterium]